MKLIFSFAILGLVALTSCKKDYTCSCTTTTHRPEFTYGGMEIQSDSTMTATASTTIKDKKDDAKSSCENGSSSTSTPSPYASYGASPTTTTITCSIKD